MADWSAIEGAGLVLLGCGKMGGAMLAGWLDRGLDPGAVWVVDPDPAPWLYDRGVRVNADLPEAPAVVVLAVKPQLMDGALPQVARFGDGSTLFVSIAAGTRIVALRETLGAATPVVRVMPNTPAAIGRGMMALVGTDEVAAGDMDLAERLLSAVGRTVRLDDEGQMDAVTAVSGSGPAYVFHLIEAMADAGAAEGLPRALALDLALGTVAGAAALAEASDETPATLRANVTSPGGTTAAALEVLTDADSGFPPLLRRAIAAAAQRSRDLGG